MSKFWKWFLGITAVAAVTTTAVITTTDKGGVTNDNSNKTDTVSTKRPMYGVNCITWYSEVGFDKDFFLKAADSLHVDYFRIPGGTRMNSFDPRTDTFGTAPGLKYIKSMVDYTHATVMWGLNMNLPLDVEIQWLEDAASMGCFDRNASGQPIYEYGNELNGASYDATVFPDGKVYGDKVKAWEVEFKKHFPNGTAIAVGEAKNRKALQTWNKDVRERNPGMLLAIHPYPDGKFTHKGIFDSAALRHLLDSAWQHDFGNDGIDPKTVAVTEGNFADHENEPVSELDTLNEDQIGIATKFWYQYWTDKGCPFINKHNITSDKLQQYPFIDANKKAAFLTPAGKALREFMEDKRTTYNQVKLTLFAGAFFADTAPYFGVYPATFQQTWGVNIGRRVVYASLWRGGTPYTDSILLNVDWNYYHTYGKDSATFGKKALQIYNYLHPKMVVVENEELLSGDLTQYIKNLQATAWRIPNKTTNGGVTMLELGKWYYKKTGDTGWLNRNCTATIKAGLLAGDYDSDSTRVNNLLLAVKNAAGIQYWNVHFYFGYQQQCQGIVRCINYASTFIGKRAMSNEFGTYSSATWAKDSAVSIARQTKMYWGIVYSGTGQIGKATPWTKTAFTTSTQ